MGVVVICLVYGPVSRCCKCPCRISLSVCLRGGLLMEIRCFGIFFVRGWGMSFWFFQRHVVC